MFGKKIVYVTDSANWVIKEIGLSLSDYVRESNFALQNTGFIFRGVRHYSTRYSVKRLSICNPFVKNIVTYFHGENTDLELLSAFRKNLKNIDLVHTSCEKTKRHLVENGIDENKIVIIPIGIEVSKFSPVSTDEKRKIRSELGIDENAFVVGSFQKDGNGWGEGNEPKLIKGPDLFCDAMEKLKDKVPLFVLLTGPSRGYVKKRLDKAGIPYRHDFLENYYDVAKYFNALDSYLVSARIEGGPRAPMEAQASGIPIVSTDVGQVDQMISHESNGLVVDVENVDLMAESLIRIYEDSVLRDRLIANGLETVKRFDYEQIAQEYLEKLYNPLLLK